MQSIDVLLPSDDLILLLLNLLVLLDDPGVELIELLSQFWVRLVVGEVGELVCLVLGLSDYTLDVGELKGLWSETFTFWRGGRERRLATY